MPPIRLCALLLRVLFLALVTRHKHAARAWSVAPVSWLRNIFRRPQRHSFPVATPEHVDPYFMDLALKEARRAWDRYDEVPIGALVVRSSDDNHGGYEILSRAGNRVNRRCDGSAHAELLALRAAARRTGNWRLRNATLYSTLEPCPLCLAASLNFRVARIVYGAPDLRLGAIETLPNDWNERHPFHTIGDMRGGVRRDESAALLQEFFRVQRDKKPKTKRERR